MGFNSGFKGLNLAVRKVIARLWKVKIGSFDDSVAEDAGLL